MSIDVPFDPEAVCDNCGKLGAFDFMGDYFCPECLTVDENGNTCVKEKPKSKEDEIENLKSLCEDLWKFAKWNKVGAINPAFLAEQNKLEARLKKEGIIKGGLE